jgi:glycylpeptide N-tetradecanoyltransferase
VSQEITRRVHLQNVWQAVYTAGRVLPSPVSVCRYYHRSLNPRKLIEVQFSHLSSRMTMARTIKLYRLPEEPLTPGIRPITSQDVPETCRLLRQYLSKFKLSPVFAEDEFEHWFCTKPGVVYGFVVQVLTTIPPFSFSSQ